MSTSATPGDGTRELAGREDQSCLTGATNKKRPAHEVVSVMRQSYCIDTTENNLIDEHDANLKDRQS
jgi:hypothetical protein